MILRLFNKYKLLNLTLIDQAIVSGVNFVTGLLLARFLGLELFGLFTMLWMIVMFVNSIQMAAISAPMMSIGVKHERRNEYFSGVVVQQCVFSSITFIGVFLGVSIVAYLKPDLGIEHLALPLATAAFFFQNQDFMRRYFFSREQIMLVLISDAISYLGQMALIVALYVFFELDLASVLWVVAVTSALAVILLLPRVKISVINIEFTRQSFQRNYDFSKWLVVSSIMQWMSGNYFTVIAGVLMGPVAVGALRSASNIVGITHIIFQSLDNIVPVQASKALIGGKGYLFKYLRSVAVIGGFVMLTLCLALSFFSEVIMGTIYGEDFSQYGYLLTYYSAMYIVLFLCLPITSGLKAIESTKPIFLSYLGMSIFSLLSATSFVRLWGLKGVVIGNSIALIIMLVVLSIGMFMYFYKDKRDLV